VSRIYHRHRAFGLHPSLLAFLDAWENWEAAPFPLVVLPDGGLRLDETKQHALYVAGKTKAESLAQTPHGRGAAVDVAPSRVTDAGIRYADFSRRGDFEAIGRFAKDLGLEWGGDFAGFFDGPHIQVPHWRDLPMPTTVNP
jgi:hypothetical protein